MTEEVFDIVCTGAGEHKRARITKLTFVDRELTSWRVGGSFFPPDTPKSPTPPSGVPWRPDGAHNEVYVAICVRCTPARTVELRPVKFHLLIDILRERGRTRLDISHLPF